MLVHVDDLLMYIIYNIIQRDHKNLETKTHRTHIHSWLIRKLTANNALVIIHHVIAAAGLCLPGPPAELT